MRKPSVRFAARTWVVGFGSALLTQGLFRRRFARDTAWGYNAGWQREIAVWNLGTLVTAAGLARPGVDPDRAQVQGFAVLSALFGTNHLVAAMRSPRSSSHWVGAVVNAVGLTVGLIALTGDGRVVCHYRVEARAATR